MKELDEEIESLKQKASSLLHDMRIENANKYKEMFNQGITDDQKEELEQLGINKAPECQFAKYGFEVPEFECEIYTIKDDFQIIGSVLKSGDWYPVSWDSKDGIIYNFPTGNSDDFNLTPIKKPWYEDESNKGKLITNKYDEVRKIQYISNNKVATHQQNLYEDAIKVDEWRLLEKEEVLSLYKEEK